MHRTHRTLRHASRPSRRLPETFQIRPSANFHTRIIRNGSMQGASASPEPTTHQVCPFIPAASQTSFPPFGDRLAVKVVRACRFVVRLANPLGVPPPLHPLSPKTAGRLTTHSLPLPFLSPPVALSRHLDKRRPAVSAEGSGSLQHQRVLYFAGRGTGGWSRQRYRLACRTVFRLPTAGCLRVAASVHVAHFTQIFARGQKGPLECDSRLPCGGAASRFAGPEAACRSTPVPDCTSLCRRWSSEGCWLGGGRGFVSIGHESERLLIINAPSPQAPPHAIASGQNGMPRESVLQANRNFMTVIAIPSQNKGGGALGVLQLREFSQSFWPVISCTREGLPEG